MEGWPWVRNTPLSCYLMVNCTVCPVLGWGGASFSQHHWDHIPSITIPQKNEDSPLPVSGQTLSSWISHEIPRTFNPYGLRTPTLFMKYQHYWWHSKLMEALPPSLKLMKWDHPDELVPNQGILGYVTIRTGHDYVESFKGNRFQTPNIPVFSFLNLSLWQGMYIGRLKHRASHLPFSELPLSCFMKKGLPFTHPESYPCAVPRGVQISGMPDKKTTWNAVGNEASFDQGTMSTW